MLFGERGFPSAAYYYYLLTRTQGNLSTNWLSILFETIEKSTEAAASTTFQLVS